MIPTHPEAVAGDPQTLSWAIPDGVLAVTGAVVSAPGRLGDLLADAGISAIVARPGRVLITLASGHSWRAEGAAIRTALHAALEQPHEWTVAPADDAAIAHAVAAVIAGPAGAVIARHGGQVRVAVVRDGWVSLEVAGACAGCPAAGLTIGTTLERAIRERVQGVREVVVTEVEQPSFVSLGHLLHRPDQRGQPDRPAPSS